MFVRNIGGSKFSVVLLRLKQKLLVVYYYIRWRLIVNRLDYQIKCSQRSLTLGFKYPVYQDRFPFFFILTYKIECKTHHLRRNIIYQANGNDIYPLTFNTSNSQSDCSIHWISKKERKTK